MGRLVGAAENKVQKAVSSRAKAATGRTSIKPQAEPVVQFSLRTAALEKLGAREIPATSVLNWQLCRSLQGQRPVMQ
jgi:hypothetical protein